MCPVTAAARQKRSTRGRVVIPNLVPNIRLEIAVNNGVRRRHMQRHHQRHQGQRWRTDRQRKNLYHPLEEVIRLRTGERGPGRYLKKFSTSLGKFFAWTMHRHDRQARCETRTCRTKKASRLAGRSIIGVFDRRTASARVSLIFPNAAMLVEGCSFCMKRQGLLIETGILYAFHHGFQFFYGLATEGFIEHDPAGPLGVCENRNPSRPTQHGLHVYPAPATWR